IGRQAFGLDRASLRRWTDRQRAHIGPLVLLDERAQPPHFGLDLVAALGDARDGVDPLALSEPFAPVPLTPLAAILEDQLELLVLQLHELLGLLDLPLQLLPALGRDPDGLAIRRRDAVRDDTQGVGTIRDAR